jgi:hypothetical protein
MVVSVPVAAFPAVAGAVPALASLQLAVLPVGSPALAGQAEPGVVRRVAAPAFAGRQEQAGQRESVPVVQPESELVPELAVGQALAPLSVVLAAAPVVRECAVETAVSQPADQASPRLSSAQIAGQLLRQRSYLV